jgi:hypothetical protein
LLFAPGTIPIKNAVQAFGPRLFGGSAKLADNDHFATITQTVKLYVEGMARGDLKALSQAFHPQASSIGHFDGGLEWLNVEEFVAACRAEAIGADVPVPPWEIESIEVFGDTAIARVVNQMAGMRFRDNLSLLRHEGRWQIVAKIFFLLSEDASA